MHSSVQTTTNKGFVLTLNEDNTAPSSSQISLQEKPIGELKPGQVLVKMLTAPVNPSDLVYLLGKYGLPPKYGAFVGFEGCGIVIKANAGFYGKWLVGKRVALSAQPGIDGVWAQYAITKANFCLPVRKEINNEQAATIIVNPCTSVCLVQRAKALKAKAIVVNAAASQVGKGVIRYAQMLGIKVIATVRSASNIKTLKTLGADEVLLTTASDYQEKLKAVCHQYRATVLLDSVADEDTAMVMKAMPKASTAIVYGRLTETHDPLGGKFSVADVIFREMKIEGFWLANYISKANPLQVLQLSRQVQKLFSQGIFQTDIYQAVDLKGFPAAIDHYAKHKSDGKVILLLSE